MIYGPLILQTLAHFHLRCCYFTVSCLGSLSAEHGGYNLCEWDGQSQAEGKQKTIVKLVHSSGSSHSKTRHMVLAGWGATATEGGNEQTQEKGKVLDTIKKLRLEGKEWNARKRDSGLEERRTEGRGGYGRENTQMQGKW